MSTFTARTIAVLSTAFPTYSEARAAELAERRLAEVRAQGSQQLLRH